MTLDARIITLAAKNPDLLLRFQQVGIGPDHFNEDFAKVWSFMARSAADHGEVPSTAAIESRFGWFNSERVKRRDAAAFLDELQKRRRYQLFLGSLDQAVTEADDPDTMPLALANLQHSMNELSATTTGPTVLDVFGGDAKKRMLEDLKERRRGGTVGIPTGLKRLDYVTNGLQYGRMVVIMGRPSIGKSWLNLLFCASAVMAGRKVVLFPLEMTFEETALRLYTLFSQKMFGNAKVLRNLDLANGRISTKKIAKFLAILEDRFEGQLMMADIGSMTDPYTIDRVGAEVAIWKPDMFWVDYITLMKSPAAGRDTRDDLVVKQLSNGIKQIAVRNNCVGGASAQVNREAIKTKNFLPRIENIAYGDAIGQDADVVISINRDGPFLYYSLVKHRGGPEVGKTRVNFMVDEGLIQETVDQDDEDDD